MSGPLVYRKADTLNNEPVSLSKPLPVQIMPESLESTITAAAVSAPGTGMVPGDTQSVLGGDYSIQGVLNITHTKAITAAVVAGGTGGTPGAVTITGTTGTGTKFQATGTITAGGVLSGPLMVTVAGDYTVNPTSIAVEPITGGSLSGATVILQMGALTATVNTAGLYREVPANPATTTAATGSGTGARFTLTTAAATGSAGTTTLGAGTAIIGQVGIDQTTPGTTDSVSVKSQGYSASVSVTRPNDTIAYTAGDVVGAAAAALTFPTMGPSAKEIIITSAALEVDVTSVPSGMTSFRLYLYNATPPSALADNAPWDLPAGDRASYIGYVDLGSPIDLGSTLYVQGSGMNFQTKLAGTSLFGYLVTNGAYTPTALAVKIVTLHSIAP